MPTKGMWAAMAIPSVAVLFDLTVSESRQLCFLAQQALLYALYYAEVWLLLLLMFGIAWKLVLGKAMRGYQLVSAATSDQVDEVVRLLQAGVKPDAYKDFKMGGTALHWASAKGRHSVIRILVETGGQDLLLMCLKDGCNSLHLAAERGHAEAVRELLNVATPDCRQAFLLQCANNGMSCLHRAVYKGRTAVVRLLLDEGGGSLSCMRDQNGDTCLHFAARAGHVEILEILLKAGAKCEAQNEYGRTGCGQVWLLFALSSLPPTPSPSISLLLSPFPPSRAPFLPLPPRCHQLYLRCMFILHPALHDASSSGHADAVRALLCACADPHIEDKVRYKDTLTHARTHAPTRTHIFCVQVLVVAM
jgi:hypothetical protein